MADLKTFRKLEWAIILLMIVFLVWHFATRTLWTQRVLWVLGALYVAERLCMIIGALRERRKQKEE